MAAPGSSIPNYGTYGWRQLDAERAYQQALTNISGKRRQSLAGYGYAADFDENGLPRNVRIDPYSQTGQVQNMLRGDTQQADAAEEDRIGRGLGQAGLGAQGEAAAQLEHGAHSEQLARGLMGDLTSLTQEQNDASSEHNAALWQIEHDAAQEAIGNQDFTPAAPGTDPGSEASDNELYDQPNDTRAAVNTTAAQKARIAQLIKQYTAAQKRVKTVGRKPLPKPKAAKRKVKR